MITPPQNPSGSVEPGDAVRNDAHATGSDFKAAAMNLGEQAQAEGKAGVEHLRETAAEKVDTLAGSVQAAASELRRDDIAHLSGYVSDLADGLTRFSGSLRTRSGDEILRDVGRLAHENPALFITGSIAIGFGLSRFVRASDPHHHALTVAGGARQAGDGGSHADVPAAEQGVYSYRTAGGRSTGGDSGSNAERDRPASADAASTGPIATGSTTSPASTSATPTGSTATDATRHLQGGPYS